MADIRINSLPTTASASSSDDYIALDGTTNGTRKLNAYSPTFGGNLTVSGTGTSTFTGDVSVSRSTGNPTFNLTNGASGGFPLVQFIDQRVGGNNWNIENGRVAGQLSFYSSGGGGTVMSLSATGNLTVSGGTITGGTSGLSLASGGTNQNITLTPSGTGTNVLNKGLSVLNTIGQFSGTGAPASGAGVEVGMLGTTQGLIFAYNRTTSAALPLSLQHAGGNLLIGTTTDTGEKLQVNGTGYFAGALIQLGNATVDALYRVSASNGKSSDFGDDTTGGFVRANNSQSLRFITAGNIVLTLDSSANATFAGKTYTAAGAAATPAISFSGDTDTGFYNAGGNQMALACGGGQIWNTTVNGLSMASGKDIYLGNAYVAGAPTATGYVTIKDSAGTTYKVLVGT